MTEKRLESLLEETLRGDSLRRAASFVAYLRDQDLHLERCQAGCWKDQLYWFVTFCGESVGYLLVNAPESQEAPWTFWSDDSGSPCYEHASLDAEMSSVAWGLADPCAQCGSCNGGTTKVLLGKTFENICRTSFRADDPDDAAVAVLKRLVDIRKRDILNARPKEDMNARKQSALPSVVPMAAIPGGGEVIRSFTDTLKWLSSDSRMSVPGKKGNLTETLQETEIAPFLLARHPVTASCYIQVMGGLPDGNGQGEVPVVLVTWFEAVAFCNRLSMLHGLESCYAVSSDGIDVDWNRGANGYRLPTDAEWQYACKAGTSGYRYGPVEDIAWYALNSGGHLQEVGQKTPNPWGLYDMIGNVWEWCWDLYDPEIYGPYRIFRGGSWGEEERGCGATSRRRGHPSFRIDDLGFRVARSL